MLILDLLVLPPIIINEKNVNFQVVFQSSGIIPAPGIVTAPIYG